MSLLSSKHEGTFEGSFNIPTISPFLMMTNPYIKVMTFKRKVKSYKHNNSAIHKSREVPPKMDNHRKDYLKSQTKFPLNISIIQRNIKKINLRNNENCTSLEETHLAFSKLPPFGIIKRQNINRNSTYMTPKSQKE